MHKTTLTRGSAALIAGFLVVLVGAGLFKFLWLAIEAPFFWVALVAWLVLPTLPFLIRWLMLSSSKGRADWIC